MSKTIRSFIYMLLGFVLSLNDIYYKNVNFWLIFGLVVIMDLSHVLD